MAIRTAIVSLSLPFFLSSSTITTTTTTTTERGDRFRHRIYARVPTASCSHKRGESAQIRRRHRTRTRLLLLFCWVYEEAAARALTAAANAGESILRHTAGTCVRTSSPFTHPTFMTAAAAFNSSSAVTSLRRLRRHRCLHRIQTTSCPHKNHACICGGLFSI